MGVARGEFIGRFNIETFNGDHTAGIQVLSTRNFAEDMDR